MRDYSKKTNQQIEDTEEDDFLNGMSDDQREFFKRVLFEVVDSEFQEIEEEMKDIETPPPSKRHKIRMNRLFRERFGGTFLPFPEVDNFYERVRSKLVIKFKTNQFFDHRKKRRRAG